ncbi:MAG: outer membrane beta-barrel protein [Bacteroidales bacterium]|nr:outer membrane beta-barrel protein [Bacteroidales bacterium]
MKKFIIAISIFVGFLANPAYSQLQLGAQLGPQIPIGDLGDAFNTSFGLNVSGKYFIQDNMAVGLNLGKHWFGTGSSNASFSSMPVTGLFEYYFGSSDFKPYVGMDLGLYIARGKVSWGGSSYASSEAYFGFAPKLGFAYYISYISNNIAVTVDAKFHFMTSDPMTEYIGINFGIALDL